MKKNFSILFFVLFLSSFIFSINLFSYTGAGILPYCCVDGKAYFFFALDGESENNTWGDLGGELDGEIDLNPEETAVRLAYEGSMGIFSGHSIYPMINAEEGKKFFKDRLNRNMCVEDPSDISYSLYFVEVPDKPISDFVNCLYHNEIKLKAGLNYENYTRRIKFVWVMAEELLRVINKTTYKKDKMWVCTYNNIGKITLNRYLSNELRTDEAVEIIENIINEATQSLVNPSYIWKPKIAKHEI